MSESDKGISFKMPRWYDKYTLAARVTPALLVTLPLVLGAIVWMPGWADIMKPIATLLVSMGVVSLLAHMARIRGKRVQAALIRQWGGLPSTIMLRHSDSTINPIEKLRYHQALARLVPGIKMPTATKESANPTAADNVYAACCTWLISQTVDEHKFHRLFAENMNYGFRRNLYGMRLVAIGCAVTGLLASSAKVIVPAIKHAAIPPIAVMGVLACLFLLVVFSAWLTKDVVREAADDYAKRLLASIDELAVPHTLEGS